MYCENSNHKKTQSDYTNNRLLNRLQNKTNQNKNVTGENGEHFVMMEELLHQEDIKIISICT